MQGCVDITSDSGYKLLQMKYNREALTGISKRSDSRRGGDESHSLHEYGIGREVDKIIYSVSRHTHLTDMNGCGSMPFS